MVKEPKNLLMEIFIKDHMKMIDQVVMVNITGKIKPISKATSKMGSDVEEDFGNVEQVKLTNIKVIMKMIKNGVMGSLLGPMEIYIKAITKAICEMDTDKCIGKTVVIIKVIGKMGFKINKVNLCLI